MKVFISYFYKIRFFSSNMIPVSTAIWDPKWYHSFKGQNFMFIDKNSVINGIRLNEFMPIMKSDGIYNGLKECSIKNPDECGFLSNYRKQIYSLDFNLVMNKLNNLANSIQKVIGFKEEPCIVLIVYETPDNKCSERVVLKQWFADNNYQLEEWSN